MSNVFILKGIDATGLAVPGRLTAASHAVALAVCAMVAGVGSRCWRGVRQPKTLLAWVAIALAMEVASTGLLSLQTAAGSPWVSGASLLSASGMSVLAALGCSLCWIREWWPKSMWVATAIVLLACRLAFDLPWSLPALLVSSLLGFSLGAKEGVLRCSNRGHSTAGAKVPLASLFALASLGSVAQLAVFSQGFSGPILPALSLTSALGACYVTASLGLKLWTLAAIGIISAPTVLIVRIATTVLVSASALPAQSARTLFAAALAAISAAVVIGRQVEPHLRARQFASPFMRYVWANSDKSMRACMDKWDLMNDAEKEPYQRAYDEDKRKHEAKRAKATSSLSATTRTSRRRLKDSKRAVPLFMDGATSFDSVQQQAAVVLQDKLSKVQAVSEEQNLEVKVSLEKLRAAQESSGTENVAQIRTLEEQLKSEIADLRQELRQDMTKVVEAVQTKVQTKAPVAQQVSRAVSRSKAPQKREAALHSAAAHVGGDSRPSGPTVEYLDVAEGLQSAGSVFSIAVAMLFFYLGGTSSP